MKHKVLFVCLGNICRSPAAEEIMRQLVIANDAADSICVDSAGTYGGHAGELPDARMRIAAARRGYNLAHRSRRITENDFFEFDTIVVMDDMNYEAVHRLAPSREYANRIYRMRDFFTVFPDRTYVPDPYYEGAEGFETVLDMLEDGCANLLNTLLQKRSAD